MGKLTKIEIDLNKEIKTVSDYSSAVNCFCSFVLTHNQIKLDLMSKGIIQKWRIAAEHFENADMTQNVHEEVLKRFMNEKFFDEFFEIWQHLGSLMITKQKIIPIKKSKKYTITYN